MRPPVQKAVAWLGTAGAGLLALALASRSGAQADLARALGWALLAAAGVSLLLRSTGRRVVAALVLLLGAGLAAAVARGEGAPALWAAAALAACGGIAQLLWAPGWASRQSRYERTATAGRPRSDLDVWKALDAGLDPTADDFGGSVPARENAPTSTPAGTDHEEQ